MPRPRFARRMERVLQKFSTVFKSAPAGHLDLVRAGIGAAIGLCTVFLVSRWWLGSAAGLPFLIAPMGASAVLVFAVPASPLARPWAVFGGNVISALVGIACAKLLPGSPFAAPLAGGMAIIAMRACRCLHPPGGAVALTAVIGGAPILAAGWSFALVPVALNCFLLVAVGWILNNASGHSYPHRAAATPPSPHGTGDAKPSDRAGFTLADIDAVLATYDELLDVSREDLDALFRKVETRAHKRLHGALTCEDILTRDVITAAPDEGVGQARDRLLAHGLGSMPVLDSARRVLGLVGHAQLLAGAGQSVGQVMLRDPFLVAPAMPVDELLPVLSGGQRHEVLVVAGDGSLLGVITQTDLLAALWRSHVAEQVASTSPG